MGAEYKQGGYIRSNLENEYQFTTPKQAYPDNMTTKNENYFDTMALNIEVDTYVKHN